MRKSVFVMQIPVFCNKQYQKISQEGILPEQTSYREGSLHSHIQYDTLFRMFGTAS